MGFITAVCVTTGVYFPLISFFIAIVGKNAHLLITVITAAFFQILAWLLSGSLVLAYGNNADELVGVSVLIGVLFQEIMRFAFVMMLRRAMAAILDTMDPTIANSPVFRIKMGIASGLGFAIISAVFQSTAMIAASNDGPLRAHGCPATSYYIIQGLTVVAGEFFNIIWMMMAFESWVSPFVARNKTGMSAIIIKAFVVLTPLSHLLISYVSMATYGSCAGGMVPIYIILAFHIGLMYLYIRRKALGNEYAISKPRGAAGLYGNVN